MTEIILTDKNFKDEVLKSDFPVLVDFWASWCGPCQMISPVISQITKEFEGKLKVGKLNVDENKETATNYGIMSIPTLLIFKDGKIVDQIIGALPKDKIIEHLKKFI